MKVMLDPLRAVTTELGSELASSFSETLQFLMAMNNDSFYEYLSEFDL